MLVGGPRQAQPPSSWAATATTTSRLLAQRERLRALEADRPARRRAAAAPTRRSSGESHPASVPPCSSRCWSRIAERSPAGFCAPPARWVCAPIAVHSEADAGAAVRARGRRGGAARSGAAGRVLPRRRTRCSRPPRATRRRGDPSRATASSPRARSSRGRSSTPGWSGSVRRRRRSSAMGDKISARNLMADAGVPVAAGTREPVQRRRGGARGRPRDRLPADGQGRRGRRRHRDGCRRTTTTGCGRRSRRPGPAPSGSSGRRRSCSSATSATLATSRSRCSGSATARVVALGERDCSVQRRHQKVAEETPSPGCRRSCGAGCWPVRCCAGEAVDYRNAGTVECLVDPAHPGVRLPGDEHPAAGRAPGDRAGHRHRHRRRSSC